MAAITLPTSIRATSTTKIRLVQYGATVALGNPLYLDTADNKYKLADANHVGQTAGSVVPFADLTTGDYVTRIGTASSSTVLLLSIEATGVTHA